MIFGMSETTSDGPMSGHDRTQPDTSDYILTIDEASELFAEAGVPRNPRSIRRFCHNKELDCISIETPTSSRYLISRSSLEKLIIQKQQALAFRDAHPSAATTGPDRLEPAMSGRDRLEPAVSGHDRTEPDLHPHEPIDEQNAAVIKRLEDENLNLRIDNRAKEQVITLLRDERREIQKQFQEVSYRLGAAETRVAQLAPPPFDPAVDDDGASEAPVGTSARNRAPDIGAGEPAAGPFLG